MNNTLIYGPPFCGKSAYAKAYADEHKMKFLDLYSEIEERTGDSIQDIVKTLGVDGFRNVESDIFDDLMFTYENSVIALGDYTLNTDYNAKIAKMTGNKIICLDMSLAQLLNKFNSSTKLIISDIPVDSDRRFLEIMTKRISHYKMFK